MKRIAKYLIFGAFSLPLLTPLATAQTMSEAGLSNRVKNYINSSNYKKQITSDSRFKNALKGIISSKKTPAGAKTIWNENQLKSMKSGNTYVVKGNITVSSNINVPANVRVYVEGSVHKNGTFNRNAENKTDVIFDIRNSSDVHFYGVNNAKISSNMKAVAFHITGSKNITIDGFRIENTWEAISAQWNADEVKMFNNYILNTTRRAIWMLGADKAQAVHNFIENAGWDGFDWDAYASDNIAFENVVVSAGRWNGFVEEGAQRNQIVRNLGVMATLVPYTGFQMGWADNGTTQLFLNGSNGRLTKDNYFINNAIYKPTSFKGAGGDYFSHINKGKGHTYFWGNDAIGASRATSSTHWAKATWSSDIPSTGRKTINDLDKQYNSGGGGNNQPGAGIVPPSSATRLKIKHSNKCMDASGTTNSSIIQQWACHNGSNQKFKFESRGNGWYALVDQRSRRCVDLSAGSSANGTNIQLWDCSNANTNQHFKIVDKSNGWFNLVTRNANKCIDVSGNTTANLGM